MQNFRIVVLAATVAALAGCATPQKPVSVSDTLATHAQLSTLNSLVVKAGLVDTLKGAGPYTVLAPSNAAFSKVPAKTMDELAKDPVKLKAVLTYHVLPAKVMASDLKNGNVKTVNGANLAVAKAGDYITVENALVERADIAASNGAVHIIDTVLIPPSK